MTKRGRGIGEKRKEDEERQERARRVENDGGREGDRGGEER